MPNNVKISLKNGHIGDRLLACQPLYKPDEFNIEVYNKRILY